MNDGMGMTIRDYRCCMTIDAMQHKDFAEKLVYEHGLRGDITDKFVHTYTKAENSPLRFNKHGRLTIASRNNIAKMLKHFDLTDISSGMSNLSIYTLMKDLKKGNKIFRKA